MTDDRERWALILGASSGMGEATGLALARSGYRIAGVLVGVVFLAQGLVGGAYELPAALCATLSGCHSAYGFWPWYGAQLRTAVGFIISHTTWAEVPHGATA